jgi:SAM-dependent methyltransferase
MEDLPWEDDFFDLVAGFNSFFFAADMQAALREAGRVAKPGAPVVIQVWGRPERCALTTMKDAVKPYMPEPAPAAPPFWRAGVLEGMAADAGLTPDEAFDVSWAYEFDNDEDLATAMVAPGGIVATLEQVGEDTVRSAIVNALARYRGPDGRYRLENEWHYLIARA